MSGKRVKIALEENMPAIPGQRYLFSDSDFPDSVMLLVGPSGSGKTAYGMQFLREGMLNGDRCLYVNCSPGLTYERFSSYFAGVKTLVPEFLSAFSSQAVANDEQEKSSRTQIPTRDNAPSISDLLERITISLSSKNPSSRTNSTRVVVDSLTQLIARFATDMIEKFVSELYDAMKMRDGTTGLFTITGVPSAPNVDVLGSLVDGIIQIRMEDLGQQIRREMRILSIKTANNSPKWVKFRIQQNGDLQFGEDKEPQAELRCKLCDGPIIGQVASIDADSTFHPHCLETYRKLGDIYGSNVVYSLQPGVVNANFFFIDVVGLSDPRLSVEKQIQKIENLNTLIGSCDAYNKIPKDKKIVLPTGDGMAIGFLVNPELPMQLSVQLHRKIHAFNAKQSSDKAIGVRIGLNSGPVFVVRDINSNQNVWGPGIILARRVMDLGDSGHILLADNIAETLIDLKDEYRDSIKRINPGYRIKHGQLLRLYSAYSHDFGNPEMPARIESG
jgi:KaiC/GvpD/RAD55 family RecA-like ATPase